MIIYEPVTDYKVLEKFGGDIIKLGNGGTTFDPCMEISKLPDDVKDKLTQEIIKIIEKREEFIDLLITRDMENDCKYYECGFCTIHGEKCDSVGEWKNGAICDTAIDYEDDNPINFLFSLNTRFLKKR